MRAIPCAAVAVISVLSVSFTASAFCGFFVKPGPGEVKSPATSVVLMRQGTRTVLSIQNDYEGPPEDFAMVVPLPTLVGPDAVHTLPRDIFERVNEVSAPRLVEYEREMTSCMTSTGGWGTGYGRGSGLGMTGAVSVEAQFAVGEYDIVVLGSSDSMALDTWLRDHGYRIPRGAEEVLRPYVEEGAHFLVAKVDVSRVTFVDGRARLSPLRVHYDTDRFSLPVRLGLLNSGGEQDLVIHILAADRYEVANYHNAFVPTNLRVRPATRESFLALYDAILTRTFARNPETIVTEYSWTTTSCDPCTTEPLDYSELATLGADVLPDRRDELTLTRLHYRYRRDQLGEDLVFRRAPPVVGGRGIPDEDGHFDRRVTTADDGFNAFQARYAILTSPGRDEPICDGAATYTWGYPSDAPANDAVAAVELRMASRLPRGRPSHVRLERYLFDVPAELRAPVTRSTAPRRGGGGGTPGAPARERRRETAIPASRRDRGRVSTRRAS